MGGCDVGLLELCFQKPQQPELPQSLGSLMKRLRLMRDEFSLQACPAGFHPFGITHFLAAKLPICKKT
jgi:hypothetical protein